MRVIYHDWSATKQRPHPQSVAEISHHSVLSGNRIRQCETSSGCRHKDTTINKTQAIYSRQHSPARWDGATSSSSRMRVIYHNWSATKQRPHPQSVAEISHHSVLSGNRIRQCETSSGSRHKDTTINNTSHLFPSTFAS